MLYNYKCFLLIQVNGVKRTPPVKNFPPFSVELSGGWVTLKTKWGLIVRFDGKHRVIVSVPGSYRNNLTGICGDCNRKKDDFRTKEGIDVSRKRNKYSKIGNSYKVEDDSDKPVKK